MITGSRGGIEIDERLDSDNELEVWLDNSDCSYSSDWITRDMAIEIINHLKSVFDIDNGV